MLDHGASNYSHKILNDGRKFMDDILLKIKLKEEIKRDNKISG